MKPRADLEQTADPALDPRAAGRRRGNARKDLQQGRLTGPVTPDDPDRLAFFDFEIDIAQRPEVPRRCRGTGVERRGLGFAERKAAPFRTQLFHEDITVQRAESELLRKVFYGNSEHGDERSEEGE